MSFKIFEKPDKTPRLTEMREIFKKLQDTEMSAKSDIPRNNVPYYAKLLGYSCVTYSINEKKYKSVITEVKKIYQ